MTPKIDKLEGMQKNFVVHYVTDPKRNATQAALRAGYSKNTAGSQACRLLKSVNIKAAIDEYNETLWSDEAMTYAESIAILSRMARANLGQYIDKHGNLDLEGVKDDGILITSVDSDTVHMSGEEGDGFVSKLRIKTESPKAAIDVLARLMGWNAPEKKEHTVNGGVMIVPATTDVDDWEDAAADSQKKLVEDALEM